MQAESAAFASWVDAEAPDEWPAMHWLLAKALPMIHEMLRMVPIQEQSEGFRSISYCFRDTSTHSNSYYTSLAKFFKPCVGTSQGFRSHIT